MAQELVLVLSCDVCASREGVETFTIGGRAVDLCDEDANSVPVGFRDLVALFDKHSRPTDLPAPSSRTRPTGPSNRDHDLPVLYRSCPLCDQESPTRTATSQHVTARHHPATLAAAEHETGRRFVCLCGESLPTFARLAFHIVKATRAGTPGHGFGS
jgi:hypothetical protein